MGWRNSQDLFQTATSGKFAKPHCKTTPPGFWCNSLNLFRKESERESPSLRGAQDEDQGFRIFKASGAKVYWQFFSAYVFYMFFMEFCGWLQYYFRFRSFAYRKNIRFQRDFNSCPIKWDFRMLVVSFSTRKIIQLTKGDELILGIWFLVFDQMNYIEYTMGTHISFIFTGHFTHIFRPYNLHFSVGSWGPEAVIYH